MGGLSTQGTMDDTTDRRPGQDPDTDDPTGTTPSSSRDDGTTTDTAPDRQRPPAIVVHEGPRDEAARLARDRLETPERPLVVRRADAVFLGPDPVDAAVDALRSALFVRVRTLKKVYEGDVRAVRRIPPGPAPQSIEVTLRTDEDSRTLRLDGAFARAFLDAAIEEGEIVQIDPDDLIITRRPDRTRAEGRVHEERDLVYRRAVAAFDTDTTPHRTSLYGTARGPPIDDAARRAADAHIAKLLEDRHTRLEPGILLFTDAEVLPAPVLALIAETATAPTAPTLVLQSTVPDVVDHWLVRFDGVTRLERA